MASNIFTAIKRQPRFWQIAALILALLGLFFLGVGLPPLFVPDEGRYAEIGREMAANNDFITPYLNYIKYFEKPPLYYWLTAIVIKLAGAQVFFIRCVNASLGLLGCLLTFWVTRRLFNQRTAWIATGILATSPLYLIMSRMVTLDLPVTFFLMACLYSFILGIQLTPTHKYRIVYFWICAFCAACAVLTKGLIGIVFPSLIALLWITLTQQWHLLKTIPWISSILIFFAVSLPWHILVSLKNPEFFYFYFIEQHFLRYTMKEIGHYQPFWYFIPVFALGFFPWVLFLPNAAYQFWYGKKNQHHKLIEFFLIWASVIFLFFSFSKSKLIPYILPIFPPLAILTAYYFDRALQQIRLFWLKLGVWLFLFSGILFAAIFYFFPQQVLLPRPQTAAFYLNLAGGVLIFGSISAVWFSRREFLKSFIFIILTIACCLLVAMRALPSIDSRSILPLANLLQTRLQLNEEVITYNQYYQDLPFYLQRRVSILNWRNELTYGMQFQSTKDWMINDRNFWLRVNNTKRIYFIISRGEFEQLEQTHPFQHFYVLGETLNTLLVSNQPDQKVPKM